MSDWAQGRKNETGEEILAFYQEKLAEFVQKIRKMASNPATVPYQDLIKEQADRIEKDGHVTLEAMAYFGNFLAALSTEEKALWPKNSEPKASGFTIEDGQVVREIRSLGMEAVKFLNPPTKLGQASYIGWAIAVKNKGPKR